MTVYVFAPSSENSTAEWDDPSIWSSQAVPNSATATVEFPQIIELQTGNTVNLGVTIQQGESFQVSEADISYDSLSNYGTLTVVNAVYIGQNGGLYGSAVGATLTARIFENDGQIGTEGQISVTGGAVNRGFIGGNLTVTAAMFQNIGTLSGSTGTGLTIVVGNLLTGLANLAGGTLTGGTYLIESTETLSLDVNNPITTLAAAVEYVANASTPLGVFQTYGASGTAYVSLQSSLTTIAAAGILGLEGGTYVSANPLTVQGVVVLEENANFIAPSLTVAATGTVSCSSVSGVAALTTTGIITDNGTIAAVIDPNAAGGYQYENSMVIIKSPVVGTGQLVIGPAKSYEIFGPPLSYATVTLELAAADSASVVFADAMGSLTLDSPQSFSGTIKGFTKGDSVTLSRVDLQSVSSYSYAGDSSHGVLTIFETGGATVALAFQGDYATVNFSLAAGQRQLSSSPPSLTITDTAAASVIPYTAAAAISAYQGGTLVVGALIVDNVANVAADLDMLQALKAAGDISTVILTDIDRPYSSPVTPPAFTLTATQYINDSGVLQDIGSAYSVTVTGATALQAESIAGSGRISSIAISDSTADVGAQLNQLESLAATGQISTIAVTDSSFATLSLSSTQFTNDRTAIEDMTGNFDLSVSTAALNLTLDGITGRGITVVFGGTASDYSVTAAGDGIGLTVTDTGTGRTSSDTLRSVTALQFSDFTDIVVQAPGSGAAGTVTTGNVTELYGAVFGRLPDVPGLAYYQQALAGNGALPLTIFAQWFLQSPEYANNPAHNYAQTTAGDTQFITDDYNNLLHRAPEPGAVPYYLALIGKFTGGLTQGTAAYTAAEQLAHAYVLTDFSASAEFLSDVQVTAQNPSSAQHWLIVI